MIIIIIIIILIGVIIIFTVKSRHQMIFLSLRYTRFEFVFNHLLNHNVPLAFYVQNLVTIQYIPLLLFQKPNYLGYSLNSTFGIKYNWPINSSSPKSSGKFLEKYVKEEYIVKNKNNLFRLCLIWRKIFKCLVAFLKNTSKYIF